MISSATPNYGSGSMLLDYDQDPLITYWPADEGDRYKVTFSFSFEGDCDSLQVLGNVQNSTTQSYTSGGTYTFDFTVNDVSGGYGVFGFYKDNPDCIVYIHSVKIEQYTTSTQVVCDTDSVAGYRYGFNGKEKIDEQYGIEGTAYDFGARLYDSRLGRWMAADPLAGKYPEFSPYTFVLNMPIIAIDPNGKEVYIIIYANDGSDGKKGALTRAEQIESSGTFDPTQDHVYVIEVTDLGKLKNQVEDIVTDANNNNYGKTVEVSFFGHMGADGPQGTERTSKHNLADATKMEAYDLQQLAPTGWKEINFNFDSEKSIACFYGCKSSDFANKFLAYQPNVLAAMGIYGGAGGSSNEVGDFRADEWDFFGSDVYIADAIDGKIIGKPLYTRDKSTLVIYDNITVTMTDSQGNVIPMRNPKMEVMGNAKPEVFSKKQIKEILNTK